MFRFEYAEYLYLLWLVPILLGFYLLHIAYKRKQLQSLVSHMLLYRLAPGISLVRGHMKMALLLLSLTALFIAYANPQWGQRKEKVTVTSSDIFIALDISQSMMAEDISPNRLERAKRLTERIIQALRGNRIGLILFAGNAYLQMPLSNDYSAAQLFVSSANTSQASTQGTAISEAIDLAMRAYEEGKNSQRALIIITDGENHDDEALAKASEASEAGMKIFTIGIGTEEGGWIPYTAQGREALKRDENGEPIRSVINTSLIRELADAGRGRSYLIGQGSEIITSIRNQIALIEKEEVEQRAFTDYASYFQYFLGLGIILLIIEFIIPEKTKSNRLA